MRRRPYRPLAGSAAAQSRPATGSSARAEYEVYRAEKADEATSYVHPCWVDGAPCEVVSLIAPELAREVSPEYDVEAMTAALAPALHNLPCEFCRACERDATALPKMRLGKHERALLLSLPKERYSRPIIAADENRTRRVAILRAAKKLHAAGLIWLTWRDEARERSQAPRIETYSSVRTRRTYTVKKETRDHEARYLRRAACLSPLGAAVVAAIRPDLEKGRPVRWHRVIPAAIESTRKFPSTLLQLFGWSAGDWFDAELKMFHSGSFLVRGNDARAKMREEFHRFLAARPLLKALKSRRGNE